MSSVTVVVSPVTQVIDANTFLVSVDQLDSTAFVNTRKEFTEAMVQQMRSSLKESGQLQNIGVVRMASTGRLGIVFGYTRTEAFNRNVYEPLINKWNSDNNLKSVDPGFLVVTNPKHREMVGKAYPEEFEKQRVKPQNQVLVRLVENVTDAKSAKIENIRENSERTDLPLLDYMDGISELYSVYGLKGKEIAKLYKTSDAIISQLRKARRVPDALHTLIARPKAGADGKMEVIDESDIVKIKEDSEVLYAEVLRRMALPKEDKEAIPKSHLNKLAAHIVTNEFVGEGMNQRHGSGEGSEGKVAEEIPLTRQQITELACKLAGADPKTRKLSKGKECYNYTMFNAELESYVTEWNKRKEAAAKGETVNETETPVQASEDGTVAGLAADQAAGAAAETPAPVTGTAEAAVANVGAEVSPAATASKANELLGVTDTDAEFTPEEAAIGSKATKTQMAPDAKVKMKSADLMLASVNTFASMLSEELAPEEEERPAGLIAGALQAVAFGYEMLGLDDLRKTADKMFVEYSDNLETYIKGLEQYAEDMFKQVKTKGAKPFGLQRPDVDISPLLGVIDPEDDDDDDDDEDDEGDDTDDTDDTDDFIEESSDTEE